MIQLWRRLKKCNDEVPNEKKNLISLARRREGREGEGKGEGTGEEGREGEGKGEGTEDCF